MVGRLVREIILVLITRAVILLGEEEGVKRKREKTGGGGRGEGELAEGQRWRSGCYMFQLMMAQFDS